MGSNYDCIICGCGISGLYAGLALQKKYPTWSIAILEKYKGVGGRTYSYSPPNNLDITWEMGAGRISTDHKMLISLIKKYHMGMIPLSDENMYKESDTELIQNPFTNEYVPLYFSILRMIPTEILQTKTLFEVLQGIYGLEKAHNIVKTFPYWAEIYSLRADLALHSFLEGEMNSSKNFFVLKEGFSELIHRLKKDFEEKGGDVLVRHNVLSVENGEVTMEVSDVKKKITTTKKIKKIQYNKICIFALHVDAIRKIKGICQMPMLKYVKTSPLFRIYAIFPKPVWFAGLDRVITNERPRYIIPVNPDKGVIMISYTDGDDTNYYHKIYSKEGDEGLQVAVMKDVRKLFPEISIPEPTFFKGHYWETGASYWQPGSYNVEEESKKSINPFPNIYICGESFSLRQAWVEGALEQTQLCIDKILSRN